MWIYYQIKAILVALVLLFFVLFPSCLIAIPFKTRTRLKIVSPVWEFCSKMLLRYACEARVDISEDHRSRDIAGRVPFGLYVANHQSYIDIPLTLTKVQAPPIMKKEVLYLPIFGWLAWISGAMPVSRSKVKSRQKVFDQTKARILGEKIGVQVYPEGTRSKTALPKEYKDVKRTLFMFAYNEKIPVIAISMYGTRGVLSKMGTIKPHRHIGIILHKEIDPKFFTSSEEFCKACWETVIKGHDSMKAKLGPLNENLS
jgi:1-acyl-sn-glycerol-3-phosphate acyltransferase